MWYGGKIRRVLIKLGKRFPRRLFSRRFPSSFSICLEPPRPILLCQTLVFFSFPFLGIVLRYPCNLLSNASSRDHSRDPFAAFFHGVKKREKKTSSQRNHSASKIVSNTSGTYSCILVEGRYFSFREILSFVSFSKSHISPSYLISSESPEWERLPVRLWLLTTELRFCDTVNQRRDDFFF